MNVNAGHNLSKVENGEQQVERKKLKAKLKGDIASVNAALRSLFILFQFTSSTSYHTRLIHVVRALLLPSLSLAQLLSFRLLSVPIKNGLKTENAGPPRPFETRLTWICKRNSLGTRLNVRT